MKRGSYLSIPLLQDTAAAVERAHLETEEEEEDTVVRIEKIENSWKMTVFLFMFRDLQYISDLSKIMTIIKN